MVLSFNGRADTLRCLESLAAQRGVAMHVIVVDNASADGSAAAVAAAFPAVELIALAENRGWAGGNNVGIAAALRGGAEFVCLLNNDTVIAPETMAALVAAARSLPPCLLHPGIDFADPALGVQLDAGQGASAEPIAGRSDVFPMDFAYGACLLVPAALFARIGVFDERFFLQLEEADFHARACKVGVVALCLAGARIVHAESRSFGARIIPLKTYYSVRNQLLLTEKHAAGPRAWLAGLRQAAWTVMNFAPAGSGWLAMLRWLASADPYARAGRAGFVDYVCRRFGAASAARVRALALR
ncbi:MAG: glycosyltransferase family 2 protein [Rhodospirillales bacterium]|nr:glycosyltransferase family 2 protein [Rhodospirillales bacterium]